LLKLIDVEVMIRDGGFRQLSGSSGDTYFVLTGEGVHDLLYQVLGKEGLKEI